MRRARLGAVIGALVATSVLVGTLADCHEPTEIEIDVRTDSCAVVKNAGIAVGTRDRIETEDLTAFSTRGAGCQPPGDRLGTLVIYPSGAKDAEVAVRIVVGVTRSAQECKQGDYEGCIVARRYLAFKPGESQKVVVIMQGKCVSQDCGPGAECKSGSCFVQLDDGGVLEAGGSPDGAGGPVDGASDAPSDAPADVIVDAGPDACDQCQGAGKTCTAGSSCTYNCGQTNCANTTVCAPGLFCDLSCTANNQCKNVACNPASKGCQFDCTGGNPGCVDITCAAPNCYVNCTASQHCSGFVQLGGGDAGLGCTGSGSCSNVDPAACDASVCQLDCFGSCPSNHYCNSSVSVCRGSF